MKYGLKRDSMRNFLKFCIVGGINTAITFIVFYTFSELFGVNYLLSSSFGYAAGVINSYTLNKKWTFRDRDKNIIPQFVKFTALNLISLGINIFIMYMCVDNLSLPKMFSQLIATGFTTIFNYAGSRLFIFGCIKVENLENNEAKEVSEESMLKP